MVRSTARDARRALREQQRRIHKTAVRLMTGQQCRGAAVCQRTERCSLATTFGA